MAKGAHATHIRDASPCKYGGMIGHVEVDARAAGQFPPHLLTPPPSDGHRGATQVGHEAVQKTAPRKSLVLPAPVWIALFYQMRGGFDSQGRRVLY